MSRTLSSRVRKSRHLRLESLEERRVMALAIAENLLINLDARDPSASTGVWDNTGSTPGDFQRFGSPVVQNLGPNANPAVSFGQVPNGDYYRGPISPDGIEGSGTRSIEVWAFNPSLERDEETMVAWGHRGSNTQNMTFNYSRSFAFGAAAHWANDIGWRATPNAGEWHHLVYTYDGATARVYADGVLRNSINVSLNTFNDYSILLGTQHGNTAAPGTPEISGLMGTLGLGNVRIHDGVLTPAQIINNFNEDAVRYGLPQAAPEPIHRYSFNGNANDSTGNAGAATLFNGAQIVGGELVLTSALPSSDANGQYATLPISTTLSQSNEVTVEGWFTMTATANWQRVIDFGTNTDRYLLFTPTSGDAGNPALAALKPSAGNERRATSLATTPLNTPTHFAVVVDVAGGEMHLYVNGQLAGTTQDMAGYSPINLGANAVNYLGRSFFGGDAYFRGRIDEIRIYDEALSSGQLASSFALGPNALNAAPTPANDTYAVSETGSIVTTQFGAPATSYNVPAGQVGNQGHDGPLGMDFNVNAPIEVTHLGVFDSGSNGLTSTITASIYDRNNTATPVATLTFTPADPGVLEGGSRIKQLPTSIILPAGFQGTIVAKGFNGTDLNGNSNPPPWTVNDNGGLVSYVGGARYGFLADNYPTNVDGGPANRYAAGTFKFQPPNATPFLLSNDTDPNPLQVPRIVPSYTTTVLAANFNNNQVPAGVSINRDSPSSTAGQVQNGRLELTQAVNSQQATAIINKPNPTELLRGFSATFDLLLGNGSSQPADGVAFVYGAIPDNALFGEAFNGTGLQVQFQTYNGGGQPTSFKLVYNNVLIKRVDVPVSTLVPGVFRAVQINVTPDGLVTLTHNNNEIFEVKVPGWSPQSNWRFGFGARTGGLNQQAFVDNLNINGLTNTTTSAQGVSVTVNSNGSFSYDASTSPALNALSEGEIVADTFTYTVSDGALQSTATVTINVTGVNDPVVSANAGGVAGVYTINERDNLVLSGSAVDPDTNDALTYAWDLDSDGLFDDAVGANPTVSWATLTGLAPPVNDQGTRQIRLRVTDPSGTSATATAQLVVNNAAPVASVSAPTGAVPGQSIDFDLSAIDAPADVAAGFTYVIDWDDPSANQTIAATPNNSPTTVSHVFASPGTYNVTVTARDKDNATSSVFTHTIVVEQAVEENGVLTIGGTNFDERIVVQNGRSGGLQVRINNRIIGNFFDSTEVVIFGGGGTDNITVASNVNASFTIDGGEGNDYIVGSRLADTLIGGPGNDRIQGVGGNDVITGGDGNDTLSGGIGDDTVDGEAGNDQIKGDAGNDILLGSEGNDRVSGDAGSDLVRGGDGSDTLDGGAGNDALSGDDSGDKLYGRAGNDVLVGGLFMDSLYGGAGEDLMLGSLIGDDSDDALLQLLADWNSGGSLQSRVDLLLPTIGADEDDAGDSLNGEGGANWLLEFINDRVSASDRRSPNIHSRLGSP